LKGFAKPGCPNEPGVSPRLPVVNTRPGVGGAARFAGEQALRCDLVMNGDPRRDRITPAKGNVMSDDDVKAELERLRRENAALKKGASDGIRMKVSEKGAVSVYGMGRFPVTLYKEQWLKLLSMSDEIRAFIAENEARLKAKD
jgi:hypothetical protein